AIASARSAGADVEIVVVDDGATDETLRVCKDLRGVVYVRKRDASRCRRSASLRCRRELRTVSHLPRRRRHPTAGFTRPANPHASGKPHGGSQLWLGSPWFRGPLADSRNAPSEVHRRRRVLGTSARQLYPVYLCGIQTLGVCGSWWSARRTGS